MPDVAIKLDVYGSYRTDSLGRSVARLYDPLGHISTVGLQVRTDLGLRLFVSQKLEQIQHGGDPDFLDEYYVEQPGDWRIGKQYVPFGLNRVIHEPAVAVRDNVVIPSLELPLEVAGCETGTGRERGIIGRVGGRFGFSTAIGAHFGIAGTSLDEVRIPTRAAGVGGGFKQLYGADYSSGSDSFMYRVEVVTLRGAETVRDIQDTVSDASVEYTYTRARRYELGWSHSSAEHADFFRLQAFLGATKNLFFEPMLRLKNSGLYDVTLTLHVKF